jgi:hypothetical protein
MEGSRVSLPRAGFGALLAGTLLAGALLGAAAYAGIEAATGDAAVIVAPLPAEPAAVRDLRIAAGNGPLVGDAPAKAMAGPAAIVAPLAHELPAVRIARIAAGNGPLAGDTPGTPTGSMAGPNSVFEPSVIIKHAAGHGPLE